MANNLQLPLSPVAILTCGDSKSLFFVRHCSSSRTDFEANTLFEVPQEMGSVFPLDGHDELLDDLSRAWRHCSGPSSGVTVSFMFRNVQQTSEVICSEGLPTHVKMSEKSRIVFEEAEGLHRTKHHKEQRLHIGRIVDEMTERHNPAGPPSQPNLPQTKKEDLVSS